MYQIRAYGITGNLFKQRSFTERPTLKQKRKYQDSWDNAYGAYLTLKLFKDGQEVSWFEAV